MVGGGDGTAPASVRTYRRHVGLQHALQLLGATEPHHRRAAPPAGAHVPTGDSAEHPETRKKQTIVNLYLLCAINTWKFIKVENDSFEKE